jgi:hypothetical protein
MKLSDREHALVAAALLGAVVIDHFRYPEAGPLWLGDEDVTSALWDLRKRDVIQIVFPSRKHTVLVPVQANFKTGRRYNEIE